MHVTVIGGGFAGVEAAWAAAERGAEVTLYEMRPERNTSVHRTGDLAELVCSNSFKSLLLTNASGVLKEEMRRLGSIILPIAMKQRVPAGEALAVDREAFAREVTETISSHPNIRVERHEVLSIPDDRPLVIATGPLTSEALAPALHALTGEDALAFFDAVAPTVTLESLDTSRMFRASRRGRGDGPEVSEDYWNCPFEREAYDMFYTELKNAERSTPHNPDDLKTTYFEMCLPVEEMADRGPRTLSFGPMKPIGLVDPNTGRRPWACVQLRQENKEGTLWGLVGFQTRLKWNEQKRVFRMIPGLENAEFVRFGVMHRNTYVNAPLVLDCHMQIKRHPGIFLAGQLTGVEGYLESAAIGILAGWNAARCANRLPLVSLPRETALGSLTSYLTETNPDRFAPMNANFGIMPELGEHVRDKRERGMLKGEVALKALDLFLQDTRT